MSSYKFEEVCNFCYKLSSHKASPTYTFRNKASGGGCLLESELLPARETVKCTQPRVPKGAAKLYAM